ncbi:MAG TPA: ATP synthase F0 subunit C [Candidatus Babeliales bacterium]|jgi:F0F1-type ATP synthase membrane subunit c/vacuolar-type H+-ATPase subunit K|nr:ATP synthase F0 subunit C [Candidatus Babeliales bacterium]
MNSEFLHFGAVATSIALSSISVGFGQGVISWSALKNIDRQPAAQEDIMRVAIIGMALVETVAVLGLLISILLLFYISQVSGDIFANYASVGIIAAMGITGLVVGFASSLPAQAACDAVARQPFFAQRISGFMLMTQVITQTPIIAAFLVSLFIQHQSGAIVTITDSLRLIASGLCVGIGSIGPAIGLSTFAKAAMNSIGKNSKIYDKVVSFTFISQALIETPVIFCLLIAITLLFAVPYTTEENMIDGVIFIAAGLCTGLGTIGTGISSGLTSAAACAQIGENPDSYNMLSRTSILAQSLIETIVLYTVILSLLMILFR